MGVRACRSRAGSPTEDGRLTHSSSLSPEARGRHRHAWEGQGPCEEQGLHGGQAEVRRHQGVAGSPPAAQDQSEREGGESATGSTAGVQSRPRTWSAGAVDREDQSRTRALPTPGVRTTCLWSATHANCRGRHANVERGLLCGSEEGLLKLRAKEGHRKPSSTSPGSTPQEALPRKYSTHSSHFRA